MDIQEFKRLKTEIENEILIATAKAMGEFQKKTGYNPNSISISMMEISTIGESCSKMRKFMPVQVDSTIDF